MKVTTVEGLRCGIGEGALWDDRNQHFYAVDTLAGQIVRCGSAGDDIRRFDVGQIIGSLALCENGDAIVGLATGVHRFDFNSGETTLIVDLEPQDRSLLLSEGKADPAGRFLVGSFALAMTDPVGTLHAVDLNGQSHSVLGGITVPNGLTWSPDGSKMYFADSHRNAVHVYDYDIASGRASNEELFVETSAFGGIPDGATTDSDGNYWVTICQAGIVAGFDPEGRLLTKIELPSKWVSSVAFGGANLDRLFVTSLNPQMMNLGEDPEGGKVFAVDGLGARGKPAYRCAVV